MQKNAITRAFVLAAAASIALSGCLSGGSSGSRSDGSGGGDEDVVLDFGAHVTIFNAGMPVEEINEKLLKLSQEPEFTENRHAVFFMPGTYGSDEGQYEPLAATNIVNSEVGYYTAVYGLGRSPEDVHINGALHVNPKQHNPDGNPDDDTLDSDSLTQFWRSLSNLTINPIQRPVGDDAQRPYPEGIADPNTMRWSVSQAAPLRRINMLGDLDLTGRYGSYAFGSYIANSQVEGSIISGDGPTEKSQAHWYTRDSLIGAWDGLAVSFVFSGVEGAPVSDFNPGSMTALATTPVTREAPFLYVDEQGSFNVFVPHAKSESAGVDWSTGAADGQSLSIDQFYIAMPEDSAADINQQLASGKHLILTPGVYHLDQALQVENSGTVVLGLGFATLVAMNGTAAIEVGDVDGVMLSGIMVDAGPVQSDVLIRVGQSGNHAGAPQDPTTLSDLFVRVGGPLLGTATTSVEINNGNVILDHGWLWRGDHGTGTAWDENQADHGLVVNGDDVTVLGLWVEHYQKHQVVWNGERGRTIFYQSEMPYDAPGQLAWMNGSKDGYASYVVADHVNAHHATGLAIYTLFWVPGVQVSSAIEAPEVAGVRFDSIATAVIALGGGFHHIINDYGQGANAALVDSGAYGMVSVVRLSSYPEP